MRSSGSGVCPRLLSNFAGLGALGFTQPGVVIRLTARPEDRGTKIGRPRRWRDSRGAQAPSPVLHDLDGIDPWRRNGSLRGRLR